MHYQSRNPSHERNHRLSLYPMARPDGEPPFVLGVGLLALVAVVVLLLAAAL